MYPLLRKCLFALPPEQAHELTLDWLAAAERLHLTQTFLKKAEPEPVELMGLVFPNPVGLSAGLDKNGDCLNGLGALGFGFVEIGTVTPRPQPGNPQPRLFRIPEHQAIINRLGFNNLGVDHLVEQVKKSRYDGVLGINIGKNFDTPVERAAEDYLACLTRVYDYADYITVNISSPNTPGLRDLQHQDNLRQLLSALIAQRNKLSEKSGKQVPLVVKIAPDLDTEQLKLTADTLLEQGADGIIATNTTLDRSAVVDSPIAAETGGLSGAPLREKSTQIIYQLSEHLQGELPIIGVGGIGSAEDAVEKIKAGASLVQIYTGLIYQGPKLIKQVADAIASYNHLL